MGKLFIGIGVGPGLGASTAERFAQEGFDILLTARNKDRVLELADAISKKVNGDNVASLKGRKEIAETITARVGRTTAIHHLFIVR
jgi:NADP-dependent 3-hydroxy acid dehydrogenase YdfG